MGRAVGARLAAAALFCVLSVGAWPVPAQDAKVVHEDVRFQHYGVQDGLSQTSARALLQDESGYVWVGTQDGLNRFDGYEFRVYRNDPGRDDSLPDSHVTVLEPARGGGFWVGTLGGGLARYLPQRDSFVRYLADGAPGSLANKSVIALHEGADGVLWIAGSGGELQRRPPDGNRFESVAGALRKQLGAVHAMVSLPTGELLLGTATGLWTLDADGRQATPWAEPDRMHETLAIALAPGGAVWAGTPRDGLLHFDRHGRLQRRLGVEEGLPDRHISALQLDADGRLWVATPRGLARLDGSDAPPRVWTAGSGLSGALASNRVHALMLDRSGLLWIGTWLNGLSLHVPQSEAFGSIRVYESRSPGLELAVYSLEPMPDGSLLLAPAAGLGMVRFDPGAPPGEGVWARYRSDPDDPSTLPDARISAIHRAPDGTVWIGTRNGLAQWTGEGFATYRHDPADPGSLPENAIHEIYQTADGTLWISLASGRFASLCAGCDEFREHRIATPSASSSGRDHTRVETMLEDSRGDLWIGMIPTGLYRLDRQSGTLEHFPHDNAPGSISHDSVTGMIEDRRGRLWIGTQGGGLNRMVIDAAGRPVFRHYGTAEGLASLAVGALAEDAMGRIWISTTVGISRLDPDTGAITNYGAAAGAQPMGYFVNSSAKFDDGRIAFGGLQGVTIFRPTDIAPLPPPRQVAITRLAVYRADGSADSRPVDVDGGTRSPLQLPPDSDAIDIEFSALAYAAPDRVQYQYRLDGINPDWVEVDARRRRASYSNLDPGAYLFRVRARSPGGAWSEEMRLPIRLQPAWWQTGIARAMYLIGLLLMVALVIRAVRQRRAEREINQREIAHSEQRLKLALWGTGDELWDWDIAAGQLRRQNPLDRPDADTDEVVESDQRLRDSVHPDDRERFEQALAGHRSGAGETMEVTYRVRRDDRWCWRLSRGRVVARDADGRPVRVVGTNSDITPLKENELELARINAELESRVAQRTLALHDTNASLRSTIDELRQTQQQLVEAEKMAALGGLVAGVAHEINTPLGVSVTAASYLDQEARALERQLDAGPLDPAALQQFGSTAVRSSQLILHNLRRADRMIRSFKQVAVDQSSEESRRIDLGAYLEEILMSLQPSLRRHRVDIDCPPGIEFETYPGAIYQIISNLAMNSVTHGFDEDEPGRIELVARVQDDEVVIRYGDNGRGMDAESCRRVFEPFFTTRRGAGGSGLGMHITWNLATQVLGGSIACQSTPGEGTRFTLRMPMQLATRPAA
ncbi:two-component regulator propeller domain-containing protein [Lysobacter erysipheiresistens]|uniref:histidine kinase n=1 Tax=Novilysobacter erysipheiresistens TaxID=1749332 RepID=A0ABU7YW40_9GAMM